jgi:uncharacterized membrane protein
VDLFSAFRRRRFLTAREREQIAAGLAEAQRYTAARIGLVIEERSLLDPRARAADLLAGWDIAESDRPTAVLLYARADPPAFAVEAGEAVRRLAPDAFWKALERDLHHHFDECRYCDAIFKGLAQIALQLERLFPSRDVKRET